MLACELYLGPGRSARSIGIPGHERHTPRSLGEGELSSQGEADRLPCQHLDKKGGKYRQNCLLAAVLWVGLFAFAVRGQTPKTAPREAELHPLTASNIVAAYYRGL